MKLRRHTITVLQGVILLSACVSCFTGIESTPRISDAEVSRSQASSNIDRHDILADIAPQPPSKWPKGKRFLVTDNKISLIFTASSACSDSLAGKEILFDSVAAVPSLTNETAYEIRFLRAGSPADTFFYRLPAPASRSLESDNRIEIPFTVDIDLAASADSIMRGRHFFITTPNWYNPADGMKECEGLRHVEVIIDSVRPGTSTYPLATFFHTPSQSDIQRAVYLTVGDGRASTRNFDRIFATADPRKSYPHITDEIWELIIHSRIKNGMTRDEVRLALGAPTAVERAPVRNGWLERWTYSDGIYLIFDSDGYLSDFRQ